jgi:hypothetical protein
MPGVDARDRRASSSARWHRPLFVALGVGYACVLAATTPFSTGSEIATAVALSGVSAVVLDQHLGARRDRSAVLGRLPAPTPGRIGPGALVSLALLALIVGFELFSFFAGSRFDHPTLSSMETSADRWFAAKAAIAFVWLSLGWYLVRR